MAEAGKRHFNILAAYELVLGMIQSRFDAHDPDVTAAIRLAFFQRAIWHHTTIFDAGPLMVGDFIANADRREFYTRMHENFVRFVPLGYRYPRGLRGLKFRMIKRNAYWIYSILSPVNKLRVRTIRRGSS